MYLPNARPMSDYDVVIIGSGLGGLACGIMLSREGLNVCVLEKQAVVGGCLQSFNRSASVLDTGIHYVGSLSEGQIMWQYFRYLGVYDKLRLRKLDEAGFDVINFGEQGEYRFAMGHDRFVETLVESFPDERDGIVAYDRMVKTVGNLISPEILRQGHISAGGMEYMGMPVYDSIARCTTNPLLRNVLAGNIRLSSGDKRQTSVYEYAMIQNSNIEGAYGFVGGAGHIAEALCESLRNNGGCVRTRSGVRHIHAEGDKIDYVELETGERISAKYVISSVHPSVTLSMLQNNTVIKKAFFTRIASLENSCGFFTTYLVMKPRTVRYENRNYYLYNKGDVWATTGDYEGCCIPSMLLCMQPDATGCYADVITLVTPMQSDALQAWSDTRSGHRGESYEAFKQKYASAMLDFATTRFGGLKDSVSAVYTSSPLTYRDYTATPDGTAYGIVKDCRNPVVSHLPSRTKIPNLLFTGQNLNIHGCIGVAVSAAVTCGEIVGTEYLAKKIGNA